jgi:glycerate kinase
VPLADGGEGTAAALLAARGGEWRQAAVHDALGRPCGARFAWLGDGTAVVDVAEACGLWRVADVPPDPMGASSAGAGELLRAAGLAGARRLIVGVGGTASTDGGAGLRDAFGAVPGVELIAALDVDNPLLGEHGAAAVYGPQKGASPAQVAELERRLAALGLPTAEVPGAGAGGGIGAMLMAMGAAPTRGAELVADEAGLDAALQGAGLCITAEGRVDEQTLRGKVVAEVLARAGRLGVPAQVVAGASAIEPERLGAPLLVEGDLEAAGRRLADRAAGGGESPA